MKYFDGAARMSKPQLRQSPCTKRHARKSRQEPVSTNLNGPMREAVLDQANGLTGKPVINPMHVAAVHALSVVTDELFSDAFDIVFDDVAGGGVMRSGYTNEIKPHGAWAEQTLSRAEVSGGANDDVTFVDLMETGALTADELEAGAAVQALT